MSFGLPESECGWAALSFLVHPLTHQMLFTLRLNPRKQVRFILSSSGNEIHQKGMEGVGVQLVNPAQSLLDGRNIRLNFGLGLDPFSWILRDSLCINNGVLLLYKIQ